MKERLFGVTNAQGNHGEDVKELYFYVDGTPTHSYMRMLYKYPQAAFPYDDLVQENGRRGGDMPEYEILDTGVFDDLRYFDVQVEYAKHAPDDILMRVSIENRGDQAASLDVLPQIWARNSWSWKESPDKPSLTPARTTMARCMWSGISMAMSRLIVTAWSKDAPQLTWLFCENETNVKRLFNMDGAGPFKDGFNDYLVHGDEQAIRRDAGTKAGAHAAIELEPYGRAVVYMRWRPQSSPDTCSSMPMRSSRTASPKPTNSMRASTRDPRPRCAARAAPGTRRHAVVEAVLPIRRAALARRRPRFSRPRPPAANAAAIWTGGIMCNADIVSMPDKWEYPWYASWDLAFHAAAFALIDPAFAKRQLLLLVKDRYQHPNGQIPAYEWAFGDANPPVHAWAAWRVYEIDRALTGKADRDFLELVFHKLLLNFTWWVNRKDADGHNIFQGGFLGLDNVGIFDRSSPLPTGGHIDQSDGTAWMAAYALDLMRIALELAIRQSACSSTSA
jgi:hypothetical protein